MVIKFKQKCIRCKSKYVTVSKGQKYALCYDCQKDDIHKPVKDPAMKKLFNLPEDFYVENSFLRTIKVNYLRFDKLTDKQIEAFKKTVEEMKKERGLKAKAL